MPAPQLQLARNCANLLAETVSDEVRYGCHETSLDLDFGDMTSLRRNIFRILIFLAFLALPGADVHCDDLSFNWPDVTVVPGDGGATSVIIEPIFDHHHHHDD